MRKLFLTLCFILICNISSAQIIVLNSCFQENLPKEKRYVKTRDIIIDLANRTKTTQGIDNEGAPYFYQDKDVEIQTSPGFIRLHLDQSFPYDEERTFFKINTYVIDLLNGKISNNYTSGLGNDAVNKTIIAKCEGVNGKPLKDLINSSQTEDDNNNSKSKSLLKKLLKKQ